MGAGVNVLMYMHDSRMPACMWTRGVYFSTGMKIFSIYLSVCVCACACACACDICKHNRTNSYTHTHVRAHTHAHSYSRTNMFLTCRHCIIAQVRQCVCVCVRVGARARACVRVCVRLNRSWTAGVRVCKRFSTLRLCVFKHANVSALCSDAHPG